jgi:hypothetical protein
VSMFSASFDFDGRIEMPVAYTNNCKNTTCSGTRTERMYMLLSFTLQYPITLTGYALTIGEVLTDGTTQSFQPPAPPSFDEFGIGGDFSFWTLGGLFVAADSLISSNVTYKFEAAIGTLLALPDTLSTQFLDIQQENISAVQGI